MKDTRGPLLDGEVQRAEVWGAQLAASLVGEVRDGADARHRIEPRPGHRLLNSSISLGSRWGRLVGV